MILDYLQKMRTAIGRYNPNVTHSALYKKIKGEKVCEKT